MKIAVPVMNKRLSQRCGNCEAFAFFEVNENEILIKDRIEIPPPPLESVLLPKWIKEQGANIVLTREMGERPLRIFNEHGVQVVVGIMENNPAQAVLDYLASKLIPDNFL